MVPSPSPDPDLAPLLDGVFRGPGGPFSAPVPSLPLAHLLISEFSAESQYDQIIELARGVAGLPDRTACFAGSGLGFHGFKGRSWEALPGNLHLAVHLAPERHVDRFEIAFTVLAALSVVEAVDRIPRLEGKAGIKWVNDVLVDGAKVAGILAYTLTQDTHVSSAVLGIGLNVEATPRVEPTPFVPQVACLRDHLPEGTPSLLGRVLLELLKSLDLNYSTLLDEGVRPLLERYRQRSMIVGKEVTVCSETSDRSVQSVAEGSVTEIGDNLELVLEGRPDAIRSGRLVLGRIEEMKRDRASASGDEDHAPTSSGRGAGV
jgi:BirA family biotin operon repressor/biotin-[acetyl-CoA-carboxylase] ligase